jgi:uncharacterized protein (TIGR03067 family)
MRHTITVVLLTATLSVSADDDENKKLLKKLEGSYEVASVEHLGEVLRLEMSGRVTIKGDKYTERFTGGGKGRTRQYSIAVDATKEPAHIDLKVLGGADDGKTILGIIAIEGKAMKICYDMSRDQKRPTEFKTGNNQYLLMTCERLKE